MFTLKNKQLKVYNLLFGCPSKPCDFGSMNDKPVLDVQRKGAEAHHFVLESTESPPFNVGDIVRCTVDWKRRHDHMQQHSGLNQKLFTTNIISINLDMLALPCYFRSTFDICYI